MKLDIRKGNTKWLALAGGMVLTLFSLQGCDGDGDSQIGEQLPSEEARTTVRKLVHTNVTELGQAVDRMQGGVEDVLTSDASNTTVNYLSNGLTVLNGNDEGFDLSELEGFFDEVIASANLTSGGNYAITGELACNYFGVDPYEMDDCKQGIDSLGLTLSVSSFGSDGVSLKFYVNQNLKLIQLDLTPNSIKSTVNLAQLKLALEFLVAQTGEQTTLPDLAGQMTWTLTNLNPGAEAGKAKFSFELQVEQPISISSGDGDYTFKLANSTATITLDEEAQTIASNTNMGALSVGYVEPQFEEYDFESGEMVPPSGPPSQIKFNLNALKWNILFDGVQKTVAIKELSTGTGFTGLQDGVQVIGFTADTLDAVVSENQDGDSVIEFDHGVTAQLDYNFSSITDYDEGPIQGKITLAVSGSTPAVTVREDDWNNYYVMTNGALAFSDTGEGDTFSVAADQCFALSGCSSGGISDPYDYDTSPETTEWDGSDCSLSQQWQIVDCSDPFPQPQF